MDQNLATRRVFLQRGLALLAVAPTIPDISRSNGDGAIQPV